MRGTKKTLTIQGNPWKHQGLALTFLRTLLWKWAEIGDKSRSLPPLTWNFQTTWSKYPSAEREDCSEVNGWQSKLLFVLEKQQENPSWACGGYDTEQIGGHFLHCCTFQREFQLQKFQSNGGQNTDGEGKRQMEACVIYIFSDSQIITKSFWSQQASFWKDPVQWFGQRWSERLVTVFWKWHPGAPSCPISRSYQSLRHSNYP